MLELERERAGKWIKMFENWDKYTNSEKVSIDYTIQQHSSDYRLS